MNFDYIVFDLDGTLTESKEGITKSIAYALSKMGIEPPELEVLEKYIGPPLIPCFIEDFGMSHQEAETALKFYRERFLEKGIYENAVYDGIKPLLEKLKEKGKTLVIATTKPTPQAETVLKHFGMFEMFDLVCGSNGKETLVEKPDIMAVAFKEIPLKNRSETVMVGDRKYDVLGAKAHKISSIGLTYGYGSETELMEAGADFIVSSVEQLSALLLGF